MQRLLKQLLICAGGTPRAPVGRHQDGEMNTLHQFLPYLCSELYTMRTQALCGDSAERLPCLREKADAVHRSLEAARDASAASEAWKHAPSLGAALTAAEVLRLLLGTPCCCCPALRW